MTQLSSTHSTCAVQWKMWLVNILTVLYLTAHGAAEDPQNVINQPPPPDPPKPVLKRLSPWPDVFRDEMVELNCEVEGDDWTYTWYKDEVLLREEDLNLDIMASYLNISVADPSYQGGYTCKIHLESRNVSSGFSNTVDITVHETPKPTVTKVPDLNPMYVGETVNFTCKVDVSSGWEYHWYKDGTKLSTNSIRLARSDEGKYRCKAKRGERTETGVSDDIKQDVLEIPVPFMKVLTMWPDVFPDEHVKLSCGMNSGSDWTYKWYKDADEVQPNSVISFDSNRANLDISSASAAHEGQYYCKGHLNGRPVSTSSSSGLALTVSGNKPKPLITQQPDAEKVYIGESVSYKCEVKVSSAWGYHWFKNGVPLPINNSILNINDADSSNSGTYDCMAIRDKTMYKTEHSDERIIHVSEIPVPSLKLITPWSDVFPTESVKFSCVMDGTSDWKYEWFKDGQQIQADDTVSFESDAATLSISSASASHRGQYSCLGNYKTRSVRSKFSSGLTLEVYGNKPKPLITQQPDAEKVYIGESVSYKCEVKVSSAWGYQWFKNGVPLPTNNSILNINVADSSNSGTYDCMAIRDKTMYKTEHSDERIIHVSEIPFPSLKLITPWLDVFPTESVKFSCVMDDTSDWKYEWFKDGQQIQADDTVSFESDAASLSISSASASHRGQYSCLGNYKTRSVRSKFSSGLNLQVYGNKPKPLITQQPDAEKVYIGESVSYKCEVKVSSAWGYHWFKNGVPLPINNSILNINDSDSSNSGTYDCMAIRDKTMYKTEHSDERIIHVSEIPVPSLKLITPWLDVFPTESVKFSCVMDDTSDWKYEWFKDGQQIQADDTVSFGSDAATLSISSASASHRGQYSCLGNYKTRSVRSKFSSGLTLEVYDKKPRVTLIQEPVHNIMHTEDSVSFSCHINVSSGWEYLWLQDGSPLSVSGNNHTIKSVRRTNSGSYKCQVKRGSDTVFRSDYSQPVGLTIEERPKADIVLLTGWSEVFSTNSLVLKCWVQESQDAWNYTWFKEGQPIDQFFPSERYTVTPQNDVEQSVYTCHGIRNGRPSYSKSSNSFKTKHLLLKRRMLLSIVGFIFFAIIAIFIGCFLFRLFRKKAYDEEKQEVNELFPTMAQLKDNDDVQCPLVHYLTDAELKASPTEKEENGTISDETTPLPITQEDQEMMTESQDATKNGGLVSFKQ